MKALLIEDSSGKINFSAVALLETGRADRGSSPFVCIFLSQNKLAFISLDYDQLSSYTKVLEFDIDEDLVLKILETCLAKARHSQLDSELRIALQNKALSNNCDAMSYLEFGSVVL